MISKGKTLIFGRRRRRKNRVFETPKSRFLRVKRPKKIPIFAQIWDLGVENPPLVKSRFFDKGGVYDPDLDWYWWVLSIARVSRWSEHPVSKKSGFFIAGGWIPHSPTRAENWWFSSIFKISDSLDQFKWSDNVHIASTCYTDEYYRLWEFQGDRNTLSPKNRGFSYSGEWLPRPPTIARKPMIFFNFQDFE